MSNTHGEVDLLSNEMNDWRVARNWGMPDGARNQFIQLLNLRKIQLPEWEIRVLSREKWKETEQMVEYGGMPSWINNLTNEFMNWFNSQNEGKKIGWASFDSVVKLECELTERDGAGKPMSKEKKKVTMTMSAFQARVVDVLETHPTGMLWSELKKVLAINEAATDVIWKTKASRQLEELYVYKPAFASDGKPMKNNPKVHYQTRGLLICHAHMKA